MSIRQLGPFVCFYSLFCMTFTWCMYIYIHGHHTCISYTWWLDFQALKNLYEFQQDYTYCKYWYFISSLGVKKLWSIVRVWSEWAAIELLNGPALCLPWSCQGDEFSKLTSTNLQMSDEVCGVEMFWLRSSMRDFLETHLANLHSMYRNCLACFASSDWFFWLAFIETTDQTI